MKKISLFSFICCTFAAFAVEVPAARTFDVRDLGAKGDGTTYDTAAIQKALDDCGKAGGGTVKFPAGTYLSKPLTIQTRTTVLLEEGATLLASTNQADFMKVPGDWLKATSGGDFIPFISGKDLTDVTLTGKGIIDGNGAVWWEEAEKARQKVSGYTLPRPNLIVLNRGKNIRMTGITLRNSPKFHYVPTDCEDVLIEGVTILAPEHAANTDAIDPSNCRNVKITRCLIDVGDDNVAIKSGKKVEGREFGCENIEITDCTIKHGHGISIGSEVVGGVRNVLVKNCTFEDTDNGIRIKSRREKGGVVENITFTDLTMKNVHPAISIAAYYQQSTHAKYPQGDAAQPVTATTPVFRNLTIKNVTGTSTKAAGLIVGLPESLVENVVLENINLAAAEGLTIANAKGVQLRNVQVAAAKGEAIITDNAQVERVNTATGTTYGGKTPLQWSVAMAESQIARAGTRHAWKPGGNAKWDYTVGLFTLSLLKLNERQASPGHVEFTTNTIGSFITDDGNIQDYKLEEHNIDNIAPGKTVLALYQLTKEDRYRKAAALMRKQLDTHPRTAEGGFWHKRRYTNQMWLDGLFMGAPYYAEYTKMFHGPAADFDDVAKQFQLVDKYLYDAKTGLFYHGWDEKHNQPWANPTTGTSSNFWGRGLGWYAMACVDVLDFLPANHPARPNLIAELKKVSDGIVKHQDPASGVWWQVLDQGNRSGNYLEATATAMFVYSMAKGVNKGYLSTDYVPAILKGYQGMIKNFTRTEANGQVVLTQCCQVAGLGFTSMKGGPRDGSFAYYISEPIIENDLKGVGPFILAGLELEKIPAAKP